MIELRQYQQEGVEFLTSRKTAILGDDPGLGKTFTALEAALQLTDGGRGYILAVVPAHLMAQWAEQARLYKPDLFVRLVQRHEPDSWEQGLYIMSYNSIQTSGMKSLLWVWQTLWDCVIMDEAHRLRGRKSQQFRNAQMIPAKHLYLLSGSPMERGPEDIWALLHLCDREKYRGYWKFIDAWMETTQNPWKTEVIGVKPTLREAFHAQVSQYMLRRRKTDHLDLPEVVHDVRHVPVPKKLLALHRQAKQEFRINHPEWEKPKLAMSAGALIPLLRGLTGHPPTEFGLPKADMIRDIMQDLLPQRYIIFTWYRESAHAVANYFRTEPFGSDVYVITGDVPQKERAEIIKNWQADPLGILVGTLSTVGEGMNLQAASTVFFYEHSYLPGAMDQAISRVHRLGQESDRVLAYHLLCEKTVDETVWRVAQKRQVNIDQALLEDLFSEDA